ncbi:MAG: manganese efflux pump, partial [Eubacteriales bacterium]|nr:manganese efflux pump [Eubacteriales bacterium]
MGIFEIILIGISLSMDAFAVAICSGLKMTKIHYKKAALIALFFGGFQAIMPALGWLLGQLFASYVDKYDHFIAFAL